MILTIIRSKISKPKIGIFKTTKVGQLAKSVSYTRPTLLHSLIAQKTAVKYALIKRDAKSK